MFKRLFAIYLFTAACTGLPFAGFSGGGHAQQTTTQTETHSSHTEETVDGKPIAEHDDDDHHVAKKSTKKDKGDIGKTCHHNNECAADACFVGYGDLGYCTKMCDSWSECPSHWDCKRARNAPQRICMQDVD